jgi:hypothetical protein
MALWLPHFGLAQDEGKEVIPLDHFYVKRTGGSFFRRILKDVTFGLSTGYGNTFFSHTIDGFSVYQLPNKNPQIFASSTTPRFGNWVNNVQIDSSLALGNAVVIPAAADLGFKGNALNIPLQIFAYYSFLQRYRIGMGYSYELMSIGSLHPTSMSDQISNFEPPDATGFVRKFYGMAGVSFYRMGEYLFTGDLQIGSWKPKGNFSAAVTGGTYFNFGVTIERDFSEYLKVFARPSFEFKSYELPISEAGRSIDHSVNALYLNVGVTYRIPNLRRCFLRDCHAQIDHAHGNKEYRSRKHPIYKKQNPGYGENNKELIKYKGKNKKKLDPY